MNKFYLILLILVIPASPFNLNAQTSPAFTISADTGCVPHSVTFTNLIPSNSNPQITYEWDFGNGDTSTLENPPVISYLSTGTFVVNYHAYFDTAGYFLDSVVVLSSDCNDDTPPFSVNAPDLYMILYDATMGLIFNNDPNIPVSGTEIDLYPPVTVSDSAIPVTIQTYTLEIWDDDNAQMNGDDACGVFTFTPNDSSLLLTNGQYAVMLYFSHPLDTIAYADSIYVDACLGIENSLNTIPEISISTNTATGELLITVPYSGRYYIANQLGQIIRSDDIPEGTYQYNVAISENGVYVVYGEKAVVPSRIVINH